MISKLYGLFLRDVLNLKTVGANSKNAGRIIAYKSL